MLHDEREHADLGHGVTLLTVSHESFGQQRFAANVERRRERRDPRYNEHRRS
jgi:hypothetical protein